MSISAGQERSDPNGQPRSQGRCMWLCPPRARARVCVCLFVSCDQEDMFQVAGTTRHGLLRIGSRGENIQISDWHNDIKTASISTGCEHFEFVRSCGGVLCKHYRSNASYKNPGVQPSFS